MFRKGSQIVPLRWSSIDGCCFLARFATLFFQHVHVLEVPLSSSLHPFRTLRACESASEILPTNEGATSAHLRTLAGLARLGKQQQNDNQKQGRFHDRQTVCGSCDLRALERNPTEVAVRKPKLRVPCEVHRPVHIRDLSQPARRMNAVRPLKVHRIIYCQGAFPGSGARCCPGSETKRAQTMARQIKMNTSERCASWRDVCTGTM